MNFKIIPGSQLFDDCHQLYTKGKECRSKAIKWIENYFGEKKRYSIPIHSLWGGLSGVELDQKPEGWKKVGKSYQKLFAPKVNNKAIQKEWDELPFVKKSEIKELLNYGNYSGMSDGVLVWNNLPEIIFSDNLILIKTSSVAKSYTPVSGMVEILGSEYNSLNNKISRIEN